MSLGTAAHGTISMGKKAAKNTGSLEELKSPATLEMVYLLQRLTGSLWIPEPPL